jgi:hypothetical protein
MGLGNNLVARLNWTNMETQSWALDLATACEGISQWIQ